MRGEHEDGGARWDTLHQDGRYAIWFMGRDELIQCMAGRLRAISGLPSDAIVDGVSYTPERRVFAVGVFHESFEPVLPGSIAPTLIVTWKYVDQGDVAAAVAKAVSNSTYAGSSDDDRWHMGLASVVRVAMGIDTDPDFEVKG